MSPESVKPEVHKPMNGAFFEREPGRVARDLLGCLLVHGEASGRIVEAEAYGGREDPGSHASTGPTPRNRAMYGEPGRAYVYLCYGVHEMFNVVTRRRRLPGAVLVRALEPVSGVDTMRQRRGVEDVAKLASGPGRLTEALDVSRRYCGTDLLEGELRVERGEPVENYGTSRRIGLGVDCDRELRFFERGNGFVSR
ncbi:MAG: putative 3-methyladenine DNA glycosylase [Methanonatronarchaeales archaeon]|nr:putative 3-methyladenine DNA glycosylase [Methanonatronarchaeales archaeon]